MALSGASRRRRRRSSSPALSPHPPLPPKASTRHRPTLSLRLQRAPPRAELVRRRPRPGRMWTFRPPNGRRRPILALRTDPRRCVRSHEPTGRIRGPRRPLEHPAPAVTSRSRRSCSLMSRCPSPRRSPAARWTSTRRPRRRRSRPALRRRAPSTSRPTPARRCVSSRGLPSLRRSVDGRETAPAVTRVCSTCPRHER